MKRKKGRGRRRSNEKKMNSSILPTNNSNIHVEKERKGRRKRNPYVDINE